MICSCNHIKSDQLPLIQLETLGVGLLRHKQISDTKRWEVKGMGCCINKNSSLKTAGPAIPISDTMESKAKRGRVPTKKGTVYQVDTKNKSL